MHERLRFGAFHKTRVAFHNQCILPAAPRMNAEKRSAALCRSPADSTPAFRSPAALPFLHPYPTQVPRILNPVVLVLDELPKLCRDPQVGKPRGSWLPSSLLMHRQRRRAFHGTPGARLAGHRWKEKSAAKLPPVWPAASLITD